jgi:hypothetical protein
MRRLPDAFTKPQRGRGWGRKAAGRGDDLAAPRAHHRHIRDQWPQDGARVSKLRAFGKFWYGFVAGDDWRGAVLVTLGLAGTALLVHVARVNAWWLLPAVVIAALAWSLRRATSARP